MQEKSTHCERAGKPNPAEPDKNEEKSIVSPRKVFFKIADLLLL
jgi:hypothetical protein